MHMQAVIRLKDTTVWRTGGRFEIPLEGCVINPKESNNTTVRMGNADFAGQVTTPTTQSHVL
jgi:hypothetical protein